MGRAYADTGSKNPHWLSKVSIKMVYITRAKFLTSYFMKIYLSKCSAMTFDLYYSFVYTQFSLSKVVLQRTCLASLTNKAHSKSIANNWSKVKTLPPSARNNLQADTKAVCAQWLT